MVPEMPESLGRYAIREVIGRGAMGTVYLAFDPLIERMVAVKVVRIPPWMSDEDVAMYHARFFQEAKAAGRLQHPHIVTVFDMGVDPQTRTPFIVMEFIPGENLKTRLQNEGPLPWDDLFVILYQVAQGLDYAHRQGIVHRDIKPANIMLAGDRVRIADFGIAHLPKSDMTRSGQLIGSPSYMSPEQAMGLPATPQSDLFALGVVMYECLAGQKPFDGETFSEISFRILNEPHPDLRRFREDLPDDVIELVEKLLAKDPKHRLSGADVLAREIVRILRTHGHDLPEKVQALDTMITGFPRSYSSEGTIHEERTIPVYRRAGRAWLRRTADFLAVRGPLAALFLGLAVLTYGLYAGGLLPRTGRREPSMPVPRVSGTTHTVTAPAPPTMSPLPPPTSQESPPTPSAQSSVSENPLKETTPDFRCRVTLIANYPFLSLKTRVEREDELLAETVLVPKKKTILGPIKQLVRESYVRFSVPQGVSTLRLTFLAERFRRTHRVRIRCRHGERLWIRTVIDQETHAITSTWGRVGT